MSLQCCAPPPPFRELLASSGSPGLPRSMRRGSGSAVRRRGRPGSALALASALAWLGLAAAAGGASALEIVWTSDVDGDWNEAANWDIAVPGAADTATIDRPSVALVVTHDVGNTTIGGLVLGETLSVLSGSTLSTTTLDTLAGALLEVDGTGSRLTATGTTAIDGTSLRATSGATLDLSVASGASAGAQGRSWRAEGTDSAIDLSGLVLLRGATTTNTELFVDAIAGGAIDLSAVAQVEDGSVRFVSSGIDSMIDLSAASSFLDTGSSRDVSRIEARDGGTVLLGSGTPLSVTGYDIIRSGPTSTLDTSSLENLTDSRVTATGAGTTLDLGALASADGNSFLALDGATLALPNAGYASEQAATLQASGAGGVLDLSNVTDLSGATRDRNVVDVSALDGARVDLSNATTLADGSLRLRAEGAGSVIDISSLRDFVDTGGSRDRSEIAARAGGSVLLDATGPLSITGYDVVRDGTTSSLDLSGLTSLLDSSVSAIGAGTTLDLSGLATVDGNSFVAEAGASLVLPGTSYDALDAARDLVAEGAGSALDASGWLSVDGPTRSTTVLDVVARDGGDIDLSNVASLGDGSVRFVSEGAGSTIDLSSLDRFEDSGGARDRSWLEAREGASLLVGSGTVPLSITGYDLVREGMSSTFDTAQLTQLADSSVTAIGPGATFDLSGLASYDGNSFAAEDGAVLLIDTARYAAGSARAELRADGSAALLDASAVQTLGGGASPGSSLAVRAVNGGTVDLSNATTLEDGIAQFVAEGVDSLVELTGLTRFVDSVSSGNDFSSLEARSGGELRLGPGVTEVDGYDLVVAGAGSLIELSGLADLRDSSVRLEGTGATIDLSSVASLDTNGFEARTGARFVLDRTSYAIGAETRDLRAIGVSGATPSTIDGSTIATLTGGGTNTVLRVTGLSGGVVDLGGVTSLSGTAQFVAEGPGSEVDLSSLTTFVDTESVGNNFSSLEARNGGRVALGGSAPISIDGYRIVLVGATSAIDTSQLQSLANSTVLTSGVGATLDLSGLSSVDRNSFEALGGSELALGAASYTTGDVSQRLVARGAGSRVDGSSVQLLTGGEGNALLRVQAEGGGVIDFSAAGALGGGNYAFLAEGSGSLLDLSGIQAFQGAGGFVRSSLSAEGGGTIEFGAGGAATIADYDLEVSGASSTLDLTGVGSLVNSNVTATGSGANLDLSGLSTLDDNSFFARSGATLAITTPSYSGAGRRLQALGTDGATASRLDASSLTRLDGGVVSSEALVVQALDGGVVDLMGVNTIEGAVIFEVDEPGSRLDLSSLERWTDAVPGQLSSRLEVLDGAALDLGSQTVRLDGVNLTTRDALVTGGRLEMAGDVVLNASGELDVDILLEDVRFAVGGNGIGTTSVLGDLTQTIDSLFQFGIGGASPSESDRLEVEGTATLAGEVSALRFASGGGTVLYDPAVGEQFDVLTAAAIVDAGLGIDSSTFRDGRFWEAEIVDGGLGQVLRLTVAIVPEPSTALLVGIGLALLGGRRRAEPRAGMRDHRG